MTVIRRRPSPEAGGLKPELSGSVDYRRIVKEISSQLTESEFDGFEKTIERVELYYNSLDGHTGRINPTDYCKSGGIYSEMQVEKDMELARSVSEKQKVGQIKRNPIRSFALRSEPGSWYRERLAGAYESIFVGISNEFKWFGEDSRVQRTALEDDILAGTDCVLEFFDNDNNDNNIFAGLKIDLTTSSQRDIRVGKKEDKFKTLINYLRDGAKASDFVRRQNTVRYYTDCSGNQREIQPIIPVILVTDFEDAEVAIRGIGKIIGEKDIKGHEEKEVYNIFSKHPLQLEYTLQILNQLRELRDKIFVEVRGERAERAIKEIELLMAKFEKLSKEKQNAIDNNIKLAKK